MAEQEPEETHDETGYEEDDEGGVHLRSKNNNGGRSSDGTNENSDGNGGAKAERTRSRSTKSSKRLSSRPADPSDSTAASNHANNNIIRNSSSALAVLREALAANAHRWRQEEAFVLDPSESYSLPRDAPSLCALKSVEANLFQANSPFEDRFRVDLGKCVSFFGVFDGHGGIEVVDSVKKLLVKKINDSLVEERSSRVSFSEEEAVEAVKAALSRAFVEFDRFLEAKLPPSGACALVAAVMADHLFVANAGDSRALLVQLKNGEYQGVQLSNDLNCTNIAERTRLAAEHPNEPDLFENNRVKGALEPSRGFGDFKLKLKKGTMSPSPSMVALNANNIIASTNISNNNDADAGRKWTPPYITAVPEITVNRLSPEDKYLILASDGLWEKLSNGEVVDLLASALREGKSIPTILTEKFMCVAAGGSEDDKLGALLALTGRARRAVHDDVTILCVQFNDENLEDSSRRTLGEVFANFSYELKSGDSGKLHPKFLDVSHLMHQNLTSDPDTSDH